MSTLFKTKPDRRKVERVRMTVDAVHGNKMNEFTTNRDSIDTKRKKLEQLKNEVATETNDYTRMVKEDEIEKLKEEIEKIGTGDDMISYFLDAGEYYFQYHENHDRFARAATGTSTPGDVAAQSQQPQTTQAKVASKKTKRTGRDILSFFKPAGSSAAAAAAIVAAGGTAKPVSASAGSIMSNGSIGAFVSTDSSAAAATIAHGPPKAARDVHEGTTTVANLTNEQIVERFMTCVDPAHIPPQRIDNEHMGHCDECGSDLVMYPHESKLVCTNTECAVEEFVLIESEKPSYKDPPREQSYFAYKRINHFNEWLAQFQAKESTDIPSDVYDQILVELRKERITNMATLEPPKLREILKKLKLNKYYEHIPHIINRLNGVSAPVLSSETENRLRHMFKEIQSAFVRHCPPERKNFLSYAYVLYKFCELLDMDEFLDCFPLLKSREKLHEQDKIWRKICADMQWQFIRSI